jgi:hypothetical protein
VIGRSETRDTPWDLAATLETASGSRPAATRAWGVRPRRSRRGLRPTWVRFAKVVKEAHILLQD